MRREPVWQVFWIVACGAILMGLGGREHLALDNIWPLPFLLAFFFIVYEFDVRVPGVGHLNLDHVVAFPAAALFHSPFLVGVLAASGLMASRVYRKGWRAFNLINTFSSLLVGASLALGALVFLRGPAPGRLWELLDFLWLVVAMTVALAANWFGFITTHLADWNPRQITKAGLSFAQNLRWLVLSSPFVALVVDVTRDRRYVYMVLGSLTLLVVIWSLRISSRLEEKNEALARASGRQEFLQQLTLTDAATLQSRAFLSSFLKGLSEFVAWDRSILMVFPPGGDAEEPLLLSLEGLPENLGTVRQRLQAMVDDPSLKKPHSSEGLKFTPLLMEEPGRQAVVSMATSELVFGILVVERAKAAEPFGEGDVQYLEMALGEVARYVQDDILKRQLMTTNRKLLKQTGYLSEILQISNLLRVHLDVQTILERVAKGIQSGMGFQTVLISLYRQDQHCFERIAQAGLDERWEAIQAQRPPEQDILELLEEKFRVGNCYFVGHADVRITPYDILPLNPKMPREPGDWDPMDMLVIPLRGKDDSLLGIISVDEPADGKVPSLETINALEILGNQTVNALESAQIHAQTRRQAVMDGLTHLYNHGYFQETLASMTREHAEAGLPYTVLMMDLDNFKDVNDTHGHLTGDEVLKAVAAVLDSHTRKEDIAARYGGEEFAVLLPRCGPAAALVIAERVRSAVEGVGVYPPRGGKTVGVTLSIGLASYPEDGKDHHEILERADHALYLAKRAGKNRVCLAAAG